ncbi:hypothetical protein Vretimale_16923, partial [Volvox reticuliferus]
MSDKVKSVMAKNVKNHHLQTIVRAANAKAAWDALATTFASTCNTRKIALREELSNFKWVNTEELPVYINRARQLQSDLLDVGVAVTDPELTTIILKGLPPKYHVAKTSLAMREGELDFHQVVARLTSYEATMDDIKESSAFSAHGGGGTSGRSSGSRFGGGKSNVTCHYCGKPGHYMRDCRKRLAEQSQGGNERGAEGNQRSERAPATPRKLAFALMDKSRLKDWHIDTGSEWHITYDASELQNVHTVRPEEIFSVTGYDGSKQQPTHVGRYTLKSNVDDNLEIELDNVYVVPNAMVKLISAGTLDERGVVFEFGDGKAEVRFKGETILRGKKVGRTYVISYGSGYSAGGNRACAVTGSGDSAAVLWHRRLGHLGYSNLEKMCREKMVTGMEIDRASLEAASSQICEPCIYAKQSRGPFPSTGHKAAKPLGLIHMDVCGPMPETSLGGSRYVTTVLDDCTGLSTVAFTETKEAIGKKVRTMIEALENMSGRRVKEVRTDRGREFVNKTMGDYFSNKGIIHGTTVGYTPEQNGAAERLNRTLLEKTRAMLAESGLSE